MFLEAIGINGLGLYAWDPSMKDHKQPIFRSNTEIKPDSDGYTLYDGEQLSSAELDNRYDFKGCDGEIFSATAPYGIERSGRRKYDAACKRGIGSFANTIRRGQKIKRWIKNRRSRALIYRINAKLSDDLNIRTIRPLYHGDEILVKYSAEYWEGVELQCPDGEDLSPQHNTYPLKVAGDPQLRIPPYQATKQ